MMRTVSYLGMEIVLVEMATQKLKKNIQSYKLTDTKRESFEEKK